jgi:hypothetical protein
MFPHAPGGRARSGDINSTVEAAGEAATQGGDEAARRRQYPA